MIKMKPKTYVGKNSTVIVDKWGNVFINSKYVQIMANDIIVHNDKKVISTYMDSDVVSTVINFNFLPLKFIKDIPIQYWQ